MFDVQKFRDAKAVPRVKEIPVPNLIKFFDEGEKPILKVRNVTGHELAASKEAVISNARIREMLEKLMSHNAKESAAAICEKLGVSDKTPDDLVRRINMLRYGLVEPEITNEDAVRFASLWPETFYEVTNEIFRLTSLGADLGELNASTVNQE